MVLSCLTINLLGAVVAIDDGHFNLKSYLTTKLLLNQE